MMQWQAFVAIEFPLLERLAHIGIAPGRTFEESDLSPEVFKAVEAGRTARREQVRQRAGNLCTKVNGWDLSSPVCSDRETDPDFDPSLSAFHYARVIEIPTPRWTAYDALRFGITMTPNVPMTTQERGYTPPIWYNP